MRPYLLLLSFPTRLAEMPKESSLGNFMRSPIIVLAADADPQTGPTRGARASIIRNGDRGYMVYRGYCIGVIYLVRVKQCKATSSDIPLHVP